jgi:hypothetical protein
MCSGFVVKVKYIFVYGNNKSILMGKQWQQMKGLKQLHRRGSRCHSTRVNKSWEFEQILSPVWHDSGRRWAQGPRLRYWSPGSIGMEGWRCSSYSCLLNSLATFDSCIKYSFYWGRGLDSQEFKTKIEEEMDMFYLHKGRHKGSHDPSLPVNWGFPMRKEIDFGELQGTEWRLLGGRGWHNISKRTKLIPFVKAHCIRHAQT